MLCKDLGITVRDDYSNIDDLEKLSIFQTGVLKNLRRLNGLKNALVHRYNKIEEERIIEEKKNYVDNIKEFVKNVEKVINEQLQLSE